MINVTGRIQWASCVEGSCLHNFITWFPWPLPNIVPSCNDFHDFNANVPKWVVGLKGPNDWRRPDISDDFRVSTLHFPISRGWSLDQPVAKHFEEERSWKSKGAKHPSSSLWDEHDFQKILFPSPCSHSFVSLDGRLESQDAASAREVESILKAWCCWWYNVACSKKNVGAGAECNLWPDKWQAKIW